MGYRARREQSQTPAILRRLADIEARIDRLEAAIKAMRPSGTRGRKPAWQRAMEEGDGSQSATD